MMMRRFTSKEIRSTDLDPLARFHRSMFHTLFFVTDSKLKGVHLPPPEIETEPEWYSMSKPKILTGNFLPAFAVKLKVPEVV